MLTLSPVPLGGTTELSSAIFADCLSKSILRVACHEAIAARPQESLVYWPSFEIVRWLGPHFAPGAPSVCGADDGNSRHVSTWLVDLIIGLFLECHASLAAGSSQRRPGSGPISFAMRRPMSELPSASSAIQQRFPTLAPSSSQFRTAVRSLASLRIAVLAGIG